AGQRVLIHGGAGAVGSYAIQIAKSRDCTVFTTTGPDGVDYCRELGADVVFYHTRDDFTKDERVKDLDAVLPTVAGYYRKSIPLLRRNGVFASITLLSDRPGFGRLNFPEHLWRRLEAKLRRPFGYP